MLREPVALTVAGRTDRGVHALGQVVSYDGPLPSLRSVNAVLPREISVLAAEEVPDGFSARHDARSRAYLYRVLTRDTPSPFERGRSLWSPQALDEAALQRLRGAPARQARLHRLHAARAATTGASSATSSTPAGSGPASCSSSASRRTRSCAT